MWEVFDQHPGMLLKREHISAWQVNWQPKAENAPLIAKALNIGLDSLVFIDDNPMEIEYMRAAHPQIECIQLPEETADIFATVSRVAFFDQLDITDEDRARADMMMAEQKRESLGSTLTKEEFQRELGLQVEIFSAKEDDLDRVAQLINKTNQFNLTTIRRTLDEVRQLAATKGHAIFGIQVSDKFGKYGLTGVMVNAISPRREDVDDRHAAAELPRARARGGDGAAGAARRGGAVARGGDAERRVHPDEEERAGGQLPARPRLQADRRAGLVHPPGRHPDRLDGDVDPQRGKSCRPRPREPARHAAQRPALLSFPTGRLPSFLRAGPRRAAALPAAGRELLFLLPAFRRLRRRPCFSSRR